MTEPVKIDLQYFADEGNVDNGNANVANGSAEGDTPAVSNADLLNNAFGSAGTDGPKPAVKPEGKNTAGGKNTGSDQFKIQLAPWTEQLSQEMRDNPEIAAKFAKFAKIPELAKAYLDLESKAGGVTIPGKDASAEAVAQFWEKAGRPKEADGYSFAKDKASYGAEFAQTAFAANLTETQAAAMLKGLQELGARNQLAYQENLKRKQTEAVIALEKEYGSKYKENMEYLTRGLTAAGPNVAKLLAGAGLAGEPEIIKAFIAFGQITTESGFAKGGDAGASLKSILNGGTFDYKD